MSKLTPVQALQREIDHIGDLPEKLKQLGWDSDPASGHNLLAIIGRYRAALELAKADAELQAAISDGKFIGMDAGFSLHEEVEAARAKLYETFEHPPVSPWPIPCGLLDENGYECCDHKGHEGKCSGIPF